MNENLAQLKKLAQIFNTDKLISPEEIQQIFTGIVEILATYKKGTESINEDTKSVVNKLLEDVISIHKESLSAVEEKKKELGNDFADKLTELRQMVTSIQEEMNKEEEEPEDDTDDEEEKQALIEEIMAQITLPEVKATIVSGEEIVDKINELPLDDDNKIDWARIKNAPKIGKQTISGSPTVLANAVDLDGSTRQDTYAIVWDATRGRYTHAASGGGGSGSPGGSTTQLQYNNAGAFGGISGATTNGTAVTYTTGNLIATDVKASGSGGLHLHNNTGQDCFLSGVGGGINNTAYGALKADYATATTVPYFDANKNLISSAVTPTELGYVSGVTSAIQTQLNAKGAGTVTSVSSANGALSVATGTTTPVLTVNSAPILTTARTIGTITGDATSAGSSFDGSANNTNALTLATVNSNVGSFGSATAAPAITVNAKGLVTAVSTNTITPAVGSITGLGTGVGTFLATPSSANLATAVTDETGSGSLVFGTSPTLATPVINGATLNGDLQVDGTPNTDDTWNGKSTNSFNAGATIAQFDCVYMSSSSTWLLTDADAIGTAGNVLIMMAGAAGTNGNALRVIEPGSWVRNDAWNWTVGGVLYLDTATPGGMTQTVPSGVDDAVKIVGHAVTADVIYFNPSVNWIIHV